MFGLVTRRQHDARLAAVKADRERIREQHDQAAENYRVTARQLLRISHELSTAKDVIASHIVAAKHPSSALSDAHSMAISLQEALAAADVDLRVELARLEGSDL